MDTALEREVWVRAGRRCEYCLLPCDCVQTPFQIDHIVARKHRGASASENLALSCFHCNAHKGPNIAGIDPQSGAAVPLFHPRRDRWGEHFMLEARGKIAGLTSTGRVTVLVLEMNDPDAMALRASLVAERKMALG